MYQKVGGWEGVGVVGVDDQLKAGSSCRHEGTDSGAVVSVGNKDVHKSQDRSE